MAVEIKRQKRLHKHTVLTAVVTTGLMVVSTLVAQQYVTNPASEAKVLQSLTSRVIHIQPSANGLAKISADNTTSADISSVNLEQTGRSALLTFSFQ